MEKEVKDFIEYTEHKKPNAAALLTIDSHVGHLSLIKCNEEGALIFVKQILKGIYNSDDNKEEFYAFEYSITDEVSGGEIIGLQMVEEEKALEFSKPKTVGKLEKTANRFAELFALLFGLLLMIFLLISLIVGIFASIDFLIN